MGLLDTIKDGFASGGVGLGISALSNALGIQSNGQQSLTNQSVEAQEKLMDYQNKLQMQNYRDWETDRKSTRLNSSHSGESRMPSSA